MMMRKRFRLASDPHLLDADPAQAEICDECGAFAADCHCAEDFFGEPDWDALYDARIDAELGGY